MVSTATRRRSRMTRFEAVHLLYDLINSGILDPELEDGLSQAAAGLCGDGFDPCPAECLQQCKRDSCPHAGAPEEG